MSAFTMILARLRGHNNKAPCDAIPSRPCVVEWCWWNVMKVVIRRQEETELQRSESKMR